MLRSHGPDPRRQQLLTNARSGAGRWAQHRSCWGLRAIACRRLTDKIRAGLAQGADLFPDVGRRLGGRLRHRQAGAGRGESGEGAKTKPKRVSWPKELPLEQADLVP